MKTLTQTKLGAFLSATLSRGPASLADLVAGAKSALIDISEEKLESALFMLGDANLDTAQRRNAYRVRFGDKSEEWPRGQAEEIVTAYRGILWHGSGNVSGNRPKKGAK